QSGPGRARRARARRRDHRRLRPRGSAPVMHLASVTTSGCRRCETPLDPGDLRCAICSLPVPARDDARASVAAEVLRCDACGAAVSYDVDVQAPRCAFCGSVMRLERPPDPLEEAELYLPFRVDP